MEAVTIKQPDGIESRVTKRSCPFLFFPTRVRRKRTTVTEILHAYVTNRHGVAASNTVCDDVAVEIVI